MEVLSAMGVVVVVCVILARVVECVLVVLLTGCLKGGAVSGVSSSPS